MTIVLLLAAMVSFQIGASIAKSQFPLVGPIGMVTVRIGLGTLILLITLRPWRTRRVLSAWRPLLIYGVSLGLMNTFFYLALSRIPQGVAVAIEFIGPLTVATLTSQRRVDFLWIVLAAASLILLLPVSHIGAGTDLSGMLLALAAAGCWALYIVYGQKVGTAYGAPATAMGSMISASFVVPLGFATRGPVLLSREVLVPGLLVAVLSTALPYTLEMIALTRLSARAFGILMSLEPAVGAIMGYGYLGERLTATQWGAIALIIVASIGSTYRSRVPS
jgi:inner membrane transporter RhtA